jgi:tRNA (cmo5U34)-methyltransferase
MANEPFRLHLDEQISQRYLDTGRFFVLERERQMRMMANLLQGVPDPRQVLELYCREGLPSEMILKGFAQASYLNFNPSAVMLARASRRLSRYSDRVIPHSFDLADLSWRTLDYPTQAVVSSPSTIWLVMLRGCCSTMFTTSLFRVGFTSSPIRSIQ